MITIRKAKPSDFEDYYLLWNYLQNSWHDNSSKEEKEFEARNPRTKKKYCKKSFLKIISEKNRQIYFAIIEKKIVGFIEVSYTPFKESSRIIKKRGWICDLAVNEKYQRKGVASALRDKGLDWLRNKNIKFVSLDYDPGNKSLEKMYIKWGFKDNYASERLMKL